MSAADPDDDAAGNAGRVQGVATDHRCGGPWALLRQDAYDTWVTIQTISLTPAAGQIARLTATGDTITAYINNAQVAQATDATHEDTRHGVYAMNATKYFDNVQIKAA